MSRFIRRRLDQLGKQVEEGTDEEALAAVKAIAKLTGDVAAELEKGRCHWCGSLEPLIDDPEHEWYRGYPFCPNCGGT